MKILRPVSIMAALIGLALIAPLASDPTEASVQAAKDAGKTKDPKKDPGKTKDLKKDAGKTNGPKDLKAAKPSVQKTATSSVKPIVKKPPESQKTSDQQIVQAIRILQSVKKTLTMGDHDYGGHRGTAVRDVGKAENQLQEALKYRGQKSPGGKTSAPPPWHPEPQKFSNAQLNSKIPVLNATVNLLKQGDGDYGGHRAKAAADLGVAVASLEQALKFVKATK